MKPKLSIWSNYYYELSAEEAVERFIKNGIYCSELSDEHGFELISRSDDVIKTGKEFAEFLKERQFEMSQGHLWLKVRVCEEGAVEKLCRWIDMYEAIGIKNMVLHCDELVEEKISDEERKEKNISVLKRIAEYVSGRDITICLENLRVLNKSSIVETVEDLLYILDALESDNFGICLDTGHLNLTVKNHRDFILKAGDKLKALHIADNREEWDDHLMPFNRGTVDFEEVVKALREIGYNGVFNYEIPGECWYDIELRDSKINYIKDCYDWLMKR